MTNNYKSIFRMLPMAVLLWGMIAVAASAAGIPKITGEELKAMLGEPDLVVIDVRIERDWESATLKIPGAVWEDYFEVETWAKKYPKDKTIVLYCD
ncbi:MAG: rhodanese-like domain-containing protein [Nitrospirota bacterium]|nr:rhodanese-like domain-containing protein [Nitrospirota bacterium]